MVSWFRPSSLQSLSNEIQHILTIVDGKLNSDTVRDEQLAERVHSLKEAQAFTAATVP